MTYIVTLLNMVDGVPNFQQHLKIMLLCRPLTCRIWCQFFCTVFNVHLWWTAFSSQVKRFICTTKLHSNLFQDPMISKMILSANDFGCSDEILTIAAFLSVQVRISISYTLPFLCYFKLWIVLTPADSYSLCGFLWGEWRRNLMKPSFVLLLLRFVGSTWGQISFVYSGTLMLLSC